MWTLAHSELWLTLAMWQKIAAVTLFTNVAGFFMWCIFVVGHDCGHGTFSDFPILNDIIGHICHASILVPYYPWQLSHRRHHMFHNHESKDYSHPWYTPERIQRPDEGLARFMDRNPIVRIVFPFIGWPLYLLGMPDGSHWVPFKSFFFGARLWKESEGNIEAIKCILSTLVVCAVLAGSYYIFGSLQNMALYHLLPNVMCGWWLVTVTYLQHHNHDTMVYDDSQWSFVEAAFETVDRKFGFGIDALHHHITDGHVAHHLFFTKIPHYNLPIATKAIKNYMEENGLGNMYKEDVTYDFIYRVHSYFVNIGFRAHKAPSKEANTKKSK